MYMYKPSLNYLTTCPAVGVATHPSLDLHREPVWCVKFVLPLLNFFVDVNLTQVLLFRCLRGGEGGREGGREGRVYMYMYHTAIATGHTHNESTSYLTCNISHSCTWLLESLVSTCCLSPRIRYSLILGPPAVQRSKKMVTQCIIYLNTYTYYFSVYMFLRFTLPG